MSKYSRRKRDRAYMAWIRKQRCICCGIRYRVEAAHVGDRALGQKCPDRETLPLCSLHHRESKHSHHRIGKTFWAFWKLDRNALVGKFNQLYESRKEIAA